MRHLVKGRKLKRTNSHKKALMRNLATALITHKRIATTEAKAKELRPYVEKIITRAKRALVREQQANAQNSNKTWMDVHSRRMTAADLFGKGAVQELFETIAPKVIDRPGGYCRIIKTGIRQGDSARTAIIQLVDWYDVQDGASSFKKKKKSSQKPKAKKVEPKKEEKAQQINETAPVPEVKEPELDEKPIETPVETIEQAVESSESSEEVLTAGEIIEPADEVEEVKIKPSENTSEEEK
jgi:large subunit ribosomal protein L17